MWHGAIDVAAFTVWAGLENSTKAVYVYYTYTNSAQRDIKRKSV